MYIVQPVTTDQQRVDGGVTMALAVGIAVVWLTWAAGSAATADTRAPGGRPGAVGAAAHRTTEGA